MAEDRPFQGELMTCFICQKVERSDPAVPSFWRCLVPSDGKWYYACPDHFPADSSLVQGFGVTWLRVLVDVRRGSPDPGTAEGKE